MGRLRRGHIGRCDGGLKSIGAHIVEPLACHRVGRSIVASSVPGVQSHGFERNARAAAKQSVLANARRVGKMCGQGCRGPSRDTRLYKCVKFLETYGRILSNDKRIGS